jgi:ribosome-binding factor A
MSVRNERLKEAIREEAAELILHELSDPRLGFCTVTGVELTRDLSYCTIHVSVLGEPGVKSRTIRALNDARGLFQSRIGDRMKTRTTPRVTIELDESIERSFSVMEKIREARASDSDAGKAAATSTEPAAPDQDEDQDEDE